jgi:uncharacterized protein YqcC (DUF446 family)
MPSEWWFWRPARSRFALLISLLPPPNDSRVNVTKTNKDNSETASSLADQIEAELRKLGLWNDHISAMITQKAAFGADQLTFEAWLQSVLLARLRGASAQMDLPTSSNLHIAGIRNFDGLRNTHRLLSLLAMVDDLAISTSERQLRALLPKM